MIEVVPYGPQHAAAWNGFVAGSKNATFLFDRRFMDYHSDRFTDASQIVTEGSKVIALFPANRTGTTLQSHGGLTYGGFLTDACMSAVRMLEVVEACMECWRSAGFVQVDYKPIPHIYHALPAEEDLYALWRVGARLAQVDAAAAIDIARSPGFSKSKRAGVKAAQKVGLTVRESADWPTCWDLIGTVLAERHGTVPTHSLPEIERLAAALPGRIRLFAAYLGDRMVSALVVFDCGTTVHVQYIASDSTGREFGGVDLIVQHLLERFSDRRWLNFGISTESGGAVLNGGLSMQKEMFGARTIVYQRLAIDL
jgi:hypothetical protein